MSNRTWLLGIALTLGALSVACDGNVEGNRPTDAGTRDTGNDEDAMAPYDAGHDLDAGTDGAVIEAPRDVCTADGWCWELPHPQGHDIRGAWARSIEDVWAVGVNGLLLHYDGIGWSRSPSPTTETLNAVYGFAADDIWAAGDLGVIVHFDGATWSEVSTTASDAGAPPAPRRLRAIWGSASDDVWFAGDNGRLWHFDGTAFEVAPGTPNVVFHGLWGAASDDVWVAGHPTTLLHFDGTTWTSVPTGIANGPFAIGGLASADVWGVGNRVATHWDGTAWTAVSEGLDGFARAVIAVRPWVEATADAGVAPDASVSDGGMPDAGPPPAVLAWAFGDDGKVWAYSGGRWRSVASNLTASFASVVSLGDDDLLALGEGGVMQRWNAGARQTLSAGSFATRLHTFVDGAQTLWIGGDELITRRGPTWAQESPPTERAIYGIWGTGNELWAVGTAGTVLHLNGALWTDVSPAAAEDVWLRAVHGTAEVAWIVGNDGLALTRAAGTWTAVSTGRNVTLRDVRTLAIDDAWAVGDDATALHWNGTRWEPIDTGIENASLRAAWANAPDNVWAVGSLGSVIHWNGSAWSTAMSGGNYSLDDIVGSGDELWAVGTGGTIVHFNGDTWSAQQSGTTHNLHSIALDHEGTLWAVGDRGTVLSKRR